ncbi:histidine kinase [Pseudonocardia ailaonensis]|uniref:histidine kinase n=1 Tax=Pseudonocardia ailaonensis TaxID=367279 RepID=A0ABN2NFW8_9PSEU
MTRPLRPTRHAGLAVELLAYVFWLLVDCLQASAMIFRESFAVQHVATPAAGMVVAGIVLLRRRPGITAEQVAWLAFGASVTLTVLSRIASVPAMSFAEQLALAVVTVAALRKAADKQALLLVAAALVPIVGSPLLRIPIGSTTDAYSVLSAMGWGGTVAVGLVWRAAEARRRTQVDDARTAERMELARELHDVVAHQVTGIVVAAQAASVVARTAPDEVDRALEAIERAGTDALTAMRQMVGVLRGSSSDGARTPGAELGGIPELVSLFDPAGELVRLRADPGFEHAVLPAGVAATGFRVVQEALTNVRRHAPEASAVEIEIRMRAEELQVGVRNDGVRARRETPGGPGGFGLVGMAERVAALDGTLLAGPAGPGTWSVSARLPIR